jgi:hypothetical protein
MYTNVHVETHMNERYCDTAFPHFSLCCLIRKRHAGFLLVMDRQRKSGLATDKGHPSSAYLSYKVCRPDLLLRQAMVNIPLLLNRVDKLGGKST